ncbi:unnamed protein product, partial [Prorocentrum cordatum]
RLVLGVLAASPAAAIDVVIATPDADVCCETYGGTDANTAAARWSECRRPPPPGVPRDSYRFRREPTPAEMLEFERQGWLVARDEFVARGRRNRGPGVEPSGGALLPLAADPARAPLAAPRFPGQGEGVPRPIGGGDAVGGAGRGAGGGDVGAVAAGGPPPVLPHGDELVRVVTETMHGLQRGMVVFPGAGMPTLGDVGLYQVPSAAPGRRGPAVTSVRRMPYKDVGSFVRVNSVADARIMPIELVGDRRRRRPWRQVVELGMVTPFHDWPAQGAWGVEVHENGLRALEMAASCDGLEIAICACLEIIARGCQLVEYAYPREPMGGGASVGDDKEAKDNKNRGEGRGRAHRQSAIDAATGELIGTLNDMHGAPRRGSPRDASRPTTAQSLALDRPRQLAADAGPPPDDLDGPGAFEELRSKLAYDGSSSRLAPLRVDLLDLPPPGFRPASPQESAGSAGELIEKKLLDKVYVEFLKRLHAANLLDFR